MEQILPPAYILAKSLDPKDRRFCEEYVIDGNCDRACKAAGYKSSGPGYRILNSEAGALYLARLYNDAGEMRGIDAARVMHEWGCIGFFNILDIAVPDRDGSLELDLSGLTRDQAAAISEVRTKRTAKGLITDQTVKFHPKLDALNKIAQSFGMLVDRSEVGKPGEFKGDMALDAAMEQIKRLAGKTNQPLEQKEPIDGTSENELP